MKKFYSALPTRYARALFFAAKKTNAVSEVEQDLVNLDKLFRDHKELAVTVLNPGLKENSLRGILNSVSDRLKLNPVTRRFLDVLVEKRRIELLPSIPFPFHKMWLEHQGIVDVKVTTAVAINETLQKQITDHLSKKSGKIPVITWKQDAKILGGIVVEWPDRIFDGSIARKLETLKSRMIASV